MKPIHWDRTSAVKWERIWKTGCYRSKSAKFRSQLYECRQRSAVLWHCASKIANRVLSTTWGGENGLFHDALCSRWFASCGRGSG